MYLHNRLSPELLALVFEIEFIRAQLKADGHPAEPKLGEIQDRLSNTLVLIRQPIVSDGSEPQ